MRRDLAGRAALIAAGVGTALGAGAGLANAAPLEQDLQQGPTGQNAFDQSQPTDALAGSVPQASSLPLSGGGLALTQPAPPLDLGAVSPDQLAALGSLTGQTAPATEGQDGSTDQGATDQAGSTGMSGTADGTTPSGTTTGTADGAASPDGASTSGSTDGATGSSGYTATYGGN